MTAIELMDPKMDVGMMCNRKRKILNFEQSIEAGKVKVTDFTIEERLGIIDETFACMATWLEGHSLAQTVFTNLYLHNPGLINDRPMKTFCFAVLKIVDFIKQLVSNNASVIDEEVFQSMYGFQDNVLASSKVSAMLKDLDEELGKRCKSSSKSNELHSALYTRIKFTRAFYQYLLLINKQSADNVLQTTELNKKIELCEESFGDWKATLDLAIKPDVEEFNREQANGDATLNDYPTIMGFSPFVNQRTLPPTFPRHTKIKARPEAVEYFERLINRFKRIQDTNKCATFRELFFYCNRLSADDGFHSCICSRSILNVTNAFQPNYPLYGGCFVQIFKDDVWQFVRPFYLHNKAFFAGGRSKDYLDFFLEQCQKPLSKLLRSTCLNRARQRDKLESILYDLSGLQENAEKLDAFFGLQAQKLEIELAYSDYFNCWTTFYLIGAMIQYLLFGFELELYAEHEFHFVYWYLQENLLSAMLLILVRARNFQEQNNLSAKQRSKSAGKLSKQNKANQQNFLVREILRYNSLQFLTGGLFKLCVALMRSGVIRQPRIIAENLHVLYFRRLSPFIGVASPPFVNYNKFKEVCQSEFELADAGLQDYVRSACDRFEEAKKLLEYIHSPDAEIEQLLKVVKTNIVVLKLILSGHKQIVGFHFEVFLSKFNLSKSIFRSSSFEVDRLKPIFRS